MTTPEVNPARKATHTSKNSDKCLSSNKKISAKSLSIATAIMMGSVLLSRVAGLFREQVLASYGGTSLEMDAYVTAFLIPELLNHFLAGGFLSITFIPIFQRHLFRDDHKQAWKSFSNLLCIGTLFFTILIPLTIIFTPTILGKMGKQISDPQNLALTVRLTRIILPAQILFYWGAFFSAVQMAQQRFFLPALAPLCYNGGIIVGGVLLGPRLGIEGFAWGVLIGAFCANIIVQLPGALRSGMRLLPTLDLHHPDLFAYLKKTIPLVLGLGMSFSNEIFFRFFGSFLPEGGTSSVNYALRTTMMVVAVFGQASGVAFYPFLAKLAAQQQFEEMTELVNSVLKKIAIYLLPLSAIMIVLSKQIIAILYQRGQFSAQSTVETASVFSVYLLGTFTYSAAMIVARPFYAMQNTLLPMTVSTLVSLLSIPAYMVFSQTMGAPGIALATTLGMTLQFATLYLLWCKKHAQWKAAQQAGIVILKVLMICGAVVALGTLLQKRMETIHLFSNDIFNNLTICALTAVPSLAVIFTVYEITGIQRFRDSIRGLFRK